MKKAYLFIFGPPATRQSVKAVLDKIPEIIHWRYDMPNVFYIISENSARLIAESYRSRRTDTGRFLVAEINGENKQGWLPNETWYLLNKKEHKPASENP